MTRRFVNRRRGGLTFGIAATILLMGVLCWLITLRSAEIYLASAQEEQRLQALAAAESALVLIETQAGDRETSHTLGNTLITLRPSSMQHDRYLYSIRVDVLGRNQRPVLSGEYKAVYASEGGSRGTFLKLERTSWTGAASR